MKIPTKCCQIIFFKIHCFSSKRKRNFYQNTSEILLFQRDTGIYMKILLTLSLIQTHILQRLYIVSAHRQKHNFAGCFRTLNFLFPLLFMDSLLFSLYLLQLHIHFRGDWKQHYYILLLFFTNVIDVVFYVTFQNKDKEIVFVKFLFSYIFL